MPDDKHDWGLVKTIAEKGQPAHEKASDTLHSSRQIQTHEGTVEKPTSVIAKFKANGIQRKAAIEAISIWYRGQLDVARHAVEEAARVKKAEVSKVAEQMLMSLDAEHLRYLVSLGLQNFDFRNNALKQLGDQTAKSLKEIEQRDWPPHLVEKTIGAILRQHERFFEKILEELGTDKRLK